MRTSLCDSLGIEYPIFGFSASPQVVAAVSNAGGIGVLAATGRTPDSADKLLTWLEQQAPGKPIGVDLLMPAKSIEVSPTAQQSAMERFQAMIPDEHKKFVSELLIRFGVPDMEDDVERAQGALGGEEGSMQAHGRAILEVAFAHPQVKLYANALGTPGRDIVDDAHSRGILVGALSGKPQHAERHKAGGLDLVISQSYEAGGHTGEIGGMVLHAETVERVFPLPVVAAGAMLKGRQAAAAMALGCQGVWMGSAWLTTEEGRYGGIETPWLIDYDTPSEEWHALQRGAMEANTRDYLAATSSDTVRSKAFTGKTARGLRTPWTEAWTEPDSPGFLTMPLQPMLVAEASARIIAAGRSDLQFKPVGQVVGMMNEMSTAAQIVAEMVAEYDEVIERLSRTGRV